MRKALILFFVVLVCQVSLAQNYQLHSVYIYSFIKYVEWPDMESSDFVIGVYGKSPMTDDLKKMAAIKKAGDQAILIREISNLKNLTDLHILFVPESKSTEFEAISQQLEGSSTLIITETEGLGAIGSNINFVEKAGKLRFELNRSAMDRQNLKVSSELTKLAILI